MRLDQALTARGLAPSRARAQEMIRQGLVRVDGVLQTKPAAPVAENAGIAVSGDVHPWVGRGGMKLAHALAVFGLEVRSKTCLDLGASTGGFTDVLLQDGAAKVYAVDVGRDQLHEKLRNDPRVVNLEGTHAKDLSAALVPESIGFLCADVSFISVTKVLPHAQPLLLPGAEGVILVKPQFEAGRAALGRGGIVRDAAAQQAAVESVSAFLAREGWTVRGVTESPVTGGDGNTEYLLYAVKAE